MNKPLSVLHYQKAPSAEGSPNIAASIFKPTQPSLDALERFRIEEHWPELKGASRKEIVAFLAKKEREIHREDGEIKIKRQTLARLQEHQAAIHEVFYWSAESGLKIERPDGPSFRQLRKAVAEKRTVCLSKDPYAEVDALTMEKEVFCRAEILVVEHDWAAAFEGSNIEDASVRLPYDVCAFEFKFSGRNVIAFATQADEEIVFSPAVLCDDIWMLTDFVLPLDFDPLDERATCIELMTAIADQIKAACIALDAEVARSEAVREPYTSASKGVAQPPRTYHVVSLARRAGRLQYTGTAETGRHMRLHFRRGHWRHFEDHRTWIKWMLVGDPDLGFVDKEYRL